MAVCCPVHGEIAGKALDVRRAKLARHPAVMRRAITADRWLPKWRRVMQSVFQMQTAEVLARYERSGNTQVVAADRQKWAKDFYDATRPLTYHTVAAGVELTEGEFDAKSNGVYAALLEGKALELIPVLPLRESVDVAALAFDEFTLPHDFAGTERYLREVSEAAAGTSQRRIQGVFDRASRKGWNHEQTAQSLFTRGIADSKSRAERWSRTGTMWSYNEGAHLSYVSHHVAVEEWYTAQDDLVCIDCGSLDGQKVRTADSFVEEGAVLNLGSVPWSIEHPPLHPSCRCILLPVLSPSQGLRVPMLAGLN